MSESARLLGLLLFVSFVLKVLSVVSSENVANSTQSINNKEAFLRSHAIAPTAETRFPNTLPWVNEMFTNDKHLQSTALEPARITEEPEQHDSSAKSKILLAITSYQRFVFTNENDFSITFYLASYRLLIAKLYITAHFPEIFTIRTMKCTPFPSTAPGVDGVTVTFGEAVLNDVRKKTLSIGEITEDILSVTCTGIRFPEHGYGDARDITKMGWIDTEVEIAIHLHATLIFGANQSQVVEEVQTSTLSSPSPSPLPSSSFLNSSLFEEPTRHLIETTTAAFFVEAIKPTDAVQAEFGSAPNCVESATNLPRLVLAITDQPLMVYVNDIFELVLNGTISYFSPPDTQDKAGSNVTFLDIQNQTSTTEKDALYKERLFCRLRFYETVVREETDGIFPSFLDSEVSAPAPRIERIYEIPNESLRIDRTESVVRFPSPAEFSLENGLYIDCHGVYPQRIPTETLFKNNVISLYEAQGRYRKLFAIYDAAFCDGQLSIFPYQPIFELKDVQIEDSQAINEDYEYENEPFSALTFQEDGTVSLAPLRGFTSFSLSSQGISQSWESSRLHSFSHDVQKIRMLYRLSSQRILYPFKKDTSVYTAISSEFSFIASGFSMKISGKVIPATAYKLYPYFYSKASIIVFFNEDIGKRGDSVEFFLTFESNTQEVSEFTAAKPFYMALTTVLNLPLANLFNYHQIQGTSPGRILDIADNAFSINITLTDLYTLPIRRYNSTERAALSTIVEGIIHLNEENQKAYCIPSVVSQNTDTNNVVIRSRGTVQVICRDILRPDLAAYSVDSNRVTVSMKLFSTNKVLFSAYTSFTTANVGCFETRPKASLTNEWFFPFCGGYDDGRCGAILCDEGRPCTADKECITGFCDNHFQSMTTSVVNPFLVSLVDKRGSVESVCRDRQDDGDDDDHSTTDDVDPLPTDETLWMILLYIFGVIFAVLLLIYVYFTLVTYCEKRKIRKKQDQELHERMLDDEVEYDRYQYYEQDSVDYYDVFNNGT